LGLDSGALPFQGEDVWHAWELSWLGPEGEPCTAVARFRVPAGTANLVESKSLKLYLNSLNGTVFSSREVLRETLQSDLSAVAEGPVGVDILGLESAQLAVTPMPGLCIDGTVPRQPAEKPGADLLSVDPSPGENQVLHSNALRSLCPVTAQPDWATVVLWLEDFRLEPDSLMSYLYAFRSHQEFHEQCVERIFCDLRSVCDSGSLSVLALYTRRGGLDINPWRSSGQESCPRLRSARQ
jgi:7-cyano-7-deazaguanine reductase